MITTEVGVAILRFVFCLRTKKEKISISIPVPNKELTIPPKMAKGARYFISINKFSLLLFSIFFVWKSVKAKLSHKLVKKILSAGGVMNPSKYWKPMIS